MPDGHVNKCKDCNKQDVIINRKNKVGYYRAYDRVRGNRKTSEDCKRYREKNPKKYKAHTKLNNAIRDGKIIKQSCCQECGSEYFVVGHHDDYDKPLEVRWLCQVCHCAWHAENGEGKNTK